MVDSSDKFSPLTCAILWAVNDKAKEAVTDAEGNPANDPSHCSPEVVEMMIQLLGIKGNSFKPLLQKFPFLKELRPSIDDSRDSGEEFRRKKNMQQKFSNSVNTLRKWMAENGKDGLNMPYLNEEAAAIFAAYKSESTGVQQQTNPTPVQNQIELLAQQALDQARREEERKEEAAKMARAQARRDEVGMKILDQLAAHAAAHGKQLDQHDGRIGRLEGKVEVLEKIVTPMAERKQQPNDPSAGAKSINRTAPPSHCMGPFNEDTTGTAVLSGHDSSDDELDEGEGLKPRTLTFDAQDEAGADTNDGASIDGGANGARSIVGDDGAKSIGMTDFLLFIALLFVVAVAVYLYTSWQK